MHDGTSSREDMAARLALLRETMGFESQAAFAERTGVGVTDWNHYEKARRDLSLTSANRIRARWRVTLDWLYHGDRSGLSMELANSLPLLSDWRQKRAG